MKKFKTYQDYLDYYKKDSKPVIGSKWYKMGVKIVKDIIEKEANKNNMANRKCYLE